MSLALRLPALPALPTGALAALWKKHHWAVVALWLAFMAGLLGADLWFSHRQHLPVPEAEVAIGPTPQPLVAGVDPVDPPLDPAPAAGLEEITAEGKLPVIAPDGRTPLQVYAYPFDRSDARPRISIVLSDVGPQTRLLADAMRRLPGSVALAFSAFTPGIGTAVAAARQAGHETLLLIPAEGASPLTFDPGPGALRNGLSVQDNLQRLHIVMGKATGYVGLMVNPESTLLDMNSLPQMLLDEARKRGLALLSPDQDFTDLGLKDGSPTAQITLALDATLSPADLENRLSELEQRARETGHVVATTALYPYVIDALTKWLPTLANKGLALAPVSAVTNPIKTEISATAPAGGETHSAAPAEHH